MFFLDFGWTDPLGNHSPTTRVGLNSHSLMWCDLLQHLFVVCDLFETTASRQITTHKVPFLHPLKPHSGLDSYTAFLTSMVASSLQEPLVMWAPMTHREPLLRSSTTTNLLHNWRAGCKSTPHIKTLTYLQYSIQVHAHGLITYSLMHA